MNKRVYLFLSFFLFFAFSAEKLDAQNLDSTPVGTIIIWPGPSSTIPDGWKQCNGEPLLASKYPELLAVVQDYWGKYEGAGATQTFRLPDLRGLFIRGVSEERTGHYSDPDKNTRRSHRGTSNEVGSLQLSANIAHKHDNGSAVEDGKEFNIFGDATNAGIKSAWTGAHPNMHTGWTSVAGGNESRPVNAYINYIIKIK